MSGDAERPVAARPRRGRGSIRAVILEVVVRVQQADDRPAEGAGEQDEHDRDGEDQPATAEDQVRKVVHALKTGWSVCSRSSAATRLSSIPVAKKLHTSSGPASASAATSLTIAP